jgi:Aspartate/tyrosine/aromatic aminotransferase
MPDYPLWTAAVNLSGGTAIHYKCDEENFWYPDIADMESKITPNTRGIVVINPNNPTGAVYPRHVLEQIVALAKKYDLILFADEIYDKIVYDGIEHVSVASLQAISCVFLSMAYLKHIELQVTVRAGWQLQAINHVR